jgi:hypothetical protein
LKSKICDPYRDTLGGIRVKTRVTPVVYKTMVLTRVIPWFSFFFLLLFTVKRLKTRVERPWIDFPIAFP